MRGKEKGTSGLQWWRGAKGKRGDPQRWLARRKRKSDRHSLCLWRFSWAHPKFRDNQGVAYSHWKQLLLTAHYLAPQSWGSSSPSTSSDSPTVQAREGGGRRSGAGCGEEAWGPSVLSTQRWWLGSTKLQPIGPEAYKPQGKRGAPFLNCWPRTPMVTDELRDSSAAPPTIPFLSSTTEL